MIGFVQEKGLDTVTWLHSSISLLFICRYYKGIERHYTDPHKHNDTDTCIGKLTAISNLLGSVTQFLYLWKRARDQNPLSRDKTECDSAYPIFTIVFSLVAARFLAWAMHSRIRSKMLERNFEIQRTQRL